MLLFYFRFEVHRLKINLTSGEEDSLRCRHAHGDLYAWAGSTVTYIRLGSLGSAFGGLLES